MSYRSALGCSVLAALVLLGTACGQPSAPPLARPVPPTLSPSPPAAQQCNWRVSLRPHDPLPAPGRMPAGSAMARIAQCGYLIAGTNQYVSL
jgi:polar amino acid transport system substrate-binding protein